MEINEYKVFADKCFRDTPPPCGAVCPLAYDVREFIKLMQRGSWRSAYRLYRNSVIFPAFVSEFCPGNCEGACVRAQFPGDSAISLKGLEQALVKRMAGKKPERYQIPKKNQKIAVVGGGLAGLACAYRFSSFGYEVSLYERDALVGGFAKTVADPVWCHEVLIQEFATVNVEFHLETEVTDLASLEADVFFVATGEDERLFPVKVKHGDGGVRSESAGKVTHGDGGNTSFLTNNEKIFFAPLDPTETFSEAIARGLRAVTAMEEFLKIGKKSYDPAPVRGKVDERYYALDYDRKGKTPVPGKGEPEAYRCMSCNCDACMKVCPMMEKEKIFPRRMCNEVILTLKPNMSKRTAVRMVMGCTDCGQCKEACPEKIDMGHCISNARIDFYDSGAMSPAFHDYWLQDMEFSMSEEVAFTVRQDESRDCDVLFFPGCQLGASEPTYVSKTYEAVCALAENAGIYGGCCGVPALWAGQTKDAEVAAEKIREVWEALGRPKVITACPTCLKNLRNVHTEMEFESLYVWLASEDRYAQYASEVKHGDGGDTSLKVTTGDGGDTSGGEGDTPARVTTGDGGDTSLVRVLDPCASVEEPEVQQAVRTILTRAGYQVENAAADIGCCGFGGHIVVAVPELQKRFAERRVCDKDGVLVSYCANCRDVFANEGADARHLLGVLFGAPDARRLPPDLDERRENRRILKRMMTGESQKTVETDESLPEILITREILDKMNRELILREEVEKVIRQAEDENSMILDEADGLFYAHRRFRTSTLWVVYCKNSESIQVINVYVHRVEIREND